MDQLLKCCLNYINKVPKMLEFMIEEKHSHIKKKEGKNPNTDEVLTKKYTNVCPKKRKSPKNRSN
jgi:hypothetical protein